MNNAENVTGSLFQYETSISFVSSPGVDSETAEIAASAPPLSGTSTGAAPPPSSTF